MKLVQRTAMILGASSLASNAAISVVSSVEGFLNSTKTGVATAHNGTTQVSYDATGVSKLIVAIGTESGNNNQKVNSVTMSFNGESMVLAVQDNTIFDSDPLTGAPGDFDGGIGAIFYLDNPFQGAANFTFSASTSSGGPNGGWVSIMGLSGTAVGVGNTAATWSTQTTAGNVSTSITTSTADSFVFAMVENSGTNNSAGTPTLASGSTLTLVDNGFWGSQWGSGASASQLVPTSGTTITPTFATNAGGNIHVVAAEFLPVPEPSTVLLGALGALALLRRRR